jgi:alkylation response protein AidB-like acyl-CoA dehydrogenase
MSTTEEDVLESFQRFLVERVAPRAAEMDRDSDVLRAVFEEFKQQGGLNLRVPVSEGGSMLSERDYADYRVQLARYGGSLSFLQAQHQVAVTWLSRSPEQEVIRSLYQRIVRDGMAFGIGFLSPRHPAFEIKHGDGAYILSGDIPWVTGHGFLQQVVTSFEYDGQRHFTLLPFHAARGAGGQLSYSEPVPLIVFNALNTVRAHMDNWPVPYDQIFLSVPVDTQQVPERHNSVFTLAGACRGLQDLVNQLPSLPDGMQAECHRLAERLDRYTAAIMVDGGSPSVLRAEAAELAQDWSSLARWAYGGKALLQDHPVNRLARESWQYGVTALRPADLEAIYPSS